MKRLLAVAFIGSAFATATTLAQTSFLIGPKAEKKWMQHYYRANGAAPAPQPTTIANDGTAVTFVFPNTPDTSMLLTKHPAYNAILLGDMLGKTVSATYDIAATGTFSYYGEGTSSNPCETPASVRLYFQTNNDDLGYSQYWWSNPESDVLAPGLNLQLNAALSPANWSDWDGHKGNHDAAHTSAFNAAAADIQEIGLSFGGGCFFANGVGTTGVASFTLTDFRVS